MADGQLHDFFATPSVLMPPRYLLDTNICIYIAKRRPLEVLYHFEQLAVGEIAMSIITYGELRYGAAKSQNSALAYEKLSRLSELIPVLSLPNKAAVHYGLIRSGLERVGTPIGANDLWIAAHTLAEDLILVTNKTREFSRVPGICIENWVT